MQRRRGISSLAAVRFEVARKKWMAPKDSNIGRSGTSRVSLWSETGQRLGLILKGRDKVCYVHNPQHILHPPSRTEQFEATALTAKGNISPDDGADPQTIQLRHVCQVQQQFPHALGDQLSQMDAQQEPAIPDCYSPLKVQNSDITGFPD